MTDKKIEQYSHITNKKHIKNCSECPCMGSYSGHGEGWDECQHPLTPGGYSSIIKDTKSTPDWCPIMVNDAHMDSVLGKSKESTDALEMALEHIESNGKLHSRRTVYLAIKEALAEKAAHTEAYWQHEINKARDESYLQGFAAGKKEQPAQQGPVAIKWTLNGDKTCRYNNWLGETGFGRILITWKGWKECPDACVDEFPGDFFDAYGSPDEVKKMCEAEFAKRSGYTSLQSNKPWVDLSNDRLLELSLQYKGMQLLVKVMEELRELNNG